MPSQPLSLPPNYVAVSHLDLMRRRSRLVVHGVSLALVVPTTLSVLALLAWVDERRPGVLGGDVTGGFILVAALALVLLLGAHEAIHAACFALFGHRPSIRFRGGMLFVQIRDGVLGRDGYLVVLLAPLVLLTVVGLAALFWGPPLLAPLVAALLIVNSVGAAGDLVTAALLLRVPRRALLQQTAGGLCVYHAVSE